THIYSCVDGQGHALSASVDDVDCDRCTDPWQGGTDRGHVTADQSVSRKATGLQHHLENADLPPHGQHHSLCRAAYRFLTPGRRHYRRQPEVARGNGVAALPGDRDHPVSADLDVLHSARTCSRDRQGENTAVILRPNPTADILRENDGFAMLCFRSRQSHTS